MLTLSSLCSLIPFLPAQEAHWPQFLGVGRSVETENQKLPDQFGPDQNVKWRKQVPPGSSSPCIWGDRLFLTGHEEGTLAVLCYDRSNGELVWRKDFEKQGEEEYGHPAGSPAAPTVCTDGDLLFAYFGAYGLIALDVEGNVLWEKTFPFAQSQFGHGTSPVLHDGSVYLVRDVDGISAVFRLDAETGDELWVAPRTEAGANFGTPVVWQNSLVVAGSSVIKAYDLETGKPVWWVNGVTAIVCPSPIATQDTLYFGGWSTPNVQPAKRLATGFDDASGLTEEDLKDVESFFAALDEDQSGSLERDEIPESRAKDAFRFFDFNRSGTWEPAEVQGLMSFPKAPGRNVLLAVKAGGEGDVTASHVLWRKTRGIPYVATPLHYKGRLYYFKKGGFASCIDAETGKAYYESQRLGEAGEYYSTPIGVGDRVLVGTQRGRMLVLGTGDELEVIANHDFGESITATPAVVDNTLYLRTEQALYAIGE